MASHNHFLIYFSVDDPNKIHSVRGLHRTSMTKQEVEDVFLLARITGLKSTIYETQTGNLRYYFVPTVDGKFIGF